ncbi:hypothetical protein OAC99_01510 [Amylibacter sp.]|nr:hypothetical protein [Amylibacter sp.]
MPESAGDVEFMEGPASDQIPEDKLNPSYHRARLKFFRVSCLWLQIC